MIDEGVITRYAVSLSDGSNVEMYQRRPVVSPAVERAIAEVSLAVAATRIPTGVLTVDNLLNGTLSGFLTIPGISPTGTYLELPPPLTFFPEVAPEAPPQGKDYAGDYIDFSGVSPDDDDDERN
jgi:hypothetical protein